MDEDAPLPAGEEKAVGLKPGESRPQLLCRGVSGPCQKARHASRLRDDRGGGGMVLEATWLCAH